MRHTLVATIAIALVAAILAATAPLTGVTTWWPFVLAVAVGVAAIPDSSRIAGFAVGAVAAWVAFAARAALLPDVALAHALGAALTIVLIGLVVAASRERLPLWSGLVGAVAFLALYEPLFAANPLGFVGDSVGALTQLALAAGAGFIVAHGIAIVSPAPEPREEAHATAGLGTTEVQ
jgi:hypothetical protein